MKIKIIKPVIHAAKVHKKDSVVDLDDKLAKQLIEDKFAVAHVEPKTQPPEK